MTDAKFPRRLWIIRTPNTLSFQVCKDDEELSTPYLSVAEHDAEIGQIANLLKDREIEGDKLRRALERARDQLALYKAAYSVSKCNEALKGTL